MGNVPKQVLMANSIDLFLSHNNVDKQWTERLAAAVEADRGGPPLKGGT